MRGKTKIWTNIALLSTILSLIAALAFPSAFAATTLAAPSVVDDTIDPVMNPFVPIDITVADVESLWGVQFVLWFDPSVLMAIDSGFYSPFVVTIASEINNVLGYVALAGSMLPGETEGFSTVNPAAVAYMEFVALDRGTSVLDLEETKLADVSAGAISHMVVDGFFDNRLAGTPIASFTYTPEEPEPDDVMTFDASASSDPDGVIVSYNWNWGDASPEETFGVPTATHVYTTDGIYEVTLKVTDNDGKKGTTSQLIQVSTPPPPPTYLANLVGRKAWPEHRHFSQSAELGRGEDLLNTLSAKMTNLGTVAVNVKVVFTIYNKASGELLGTLETAEQELAPFPIVYETFTFLDTEAYGTAPYKLSVEAQLWYDSNGDSIIDAAGTTVKELGITVVP